MKIFRLALSCLFILAVISFSSCSKNEPKDGPQVQYTSYEYGVEVGDGYSLIYDITCTYTDVCTGQEVTKPVGNLGENKYFGNCDGLPKTKNVGIKVEGKLKPNAKQIVDDLIAKQQKITIGYEVHGTAGIYSDPARTYVIDIVSIDGKQWTLGKKPEQLKELMDNFPTIEIFEAHKQLK